MRNIKPIQILLIGAAAQIALVSILLWLYSAFISPIAFLYIVSIALGSALISFAVGFLLLKYFIEDRIQTIYRIIDHGSNVQISKPTVDLRNDIIGKAANESMVWARERKKEITKLDRKSVV